MAEDAGQPSRYITLTLDQAEFDVLTETRIRLQARISKELTWPEFVLELARRI